MQLIDLTGRRFGKLVVVGRAGVDGNKKVLWTCRCDCGSPDVRPQRGNDLVRGKVSSCGCEQYGSGPSANAYKHGESRSKLRYVWSAMKQRCNNPDNKDYSEYGGRGIRVCEAWGDFATFLVDMGTPPSGSSLHRKENHGDYCKANCEWQTFVGQAGNRRNSKMLTINGRTECISGWARLSGISDRTIRSRVKSNWSPEEAVFTPIQVQTGLGRRDAPKFYTPEYRAWTGMRSRCRSPGNPFYSDYGGRGIAIHPRWDNFASFLADMGPRPPGMSLDRNHPDGNYGPGLCTWRTQTEQIRNRRTTRTLTIGGVTRSLAAWAEISRIPYPTILARVKRGWPVERAVLDPR